MKILIDNGHGIETPGKRSPDGKFLEYKYNRIIASRVTANLVDCGHDASLLVPEIFDVPLAERCRRVNAVCDEVGTANVILVSIHVNAYGNGSGWTQPHGWSIYTSKGETAADTLATCIFEAAKKYLPDMQLRTDNSDGDPDFEESFYILRHSLCPAVLSENGYMTNEKECLWLQTRAARQAIVDLHVEGIVDWIIRYKKNSGILW